MQLQELLEHSYRNFHAKGLHYLCLHRDPFATVKAYFFDDECAASSEVVIPHNHRYDFVSRCLAGGLEDLRYREVGGEPNANKFDFFTPLNGGEGFVFKRPTRLQHVSTTRVPAGCSLYRRAEDVHTIRVRPGTVLLLTQLQDKGHVRVPSQSYSFDQRERKIDTSGLYDRMDQETAFSYLYILDELGVDVSSIGIKMESKRRRVAA